MQSDSHQAWLWVCAVICPRAWLHQLLMPHTAQACVCEIGRTFTALNGCSTPVMDASNSSLLRLEADLWALPFPPAVLGSTDPGADGLLRAMPARSQQTSKAGVSRRHSWQAEQQQTQQRQVRSSCNVQHRAASAIIQHIISATNIHAPAQSSSPDSSLSDSVEPALMLCCCGTRRSDGMQGTASVFIGQVPRGLTSASNTRSVSRHNARNAGHKQGYQEVTHVCDF
jgi:hypothetical protein